jgi:hypothetical protein
MLIAQNISNQHLFYGFSDSLWNDDQDSGCSTGCFIITYMGVVVDHSSNLPDPVALSSAEAEYNAGCIAMMAASHLQMLLCELEGIQESSMQATPTFFDNKSATAMGSSYKDPKHNTLITLCDATIMCERKLQPTASTCNGSPPTFKWQTLGPSRLQVLDINFLWR